MPNPFNDAAARLDKLAAPIAAIARANVARSCVNSLRNIAARMTEEAERTPDSTTAAWLKAAGGQLLAVVLTDDFDSVDLGALADTMTELAAALRTPGEL